MTWVAIDCSVPPDGQILALREQAQLNRKRLLEYSFTTHDHYRESAIENVHSSTAFGDMVFDFAKASQPDEPDKSIFWRAVGIDVLGPVVKQTEAHLKTLRELHQSLINDGKAESPLSKRFSSKLPRFKNSDKNWSQGGNRLKALCIVGELSHQGFDEMGIFQILNMQRNAGTTEEWRELFPDEDFIQEAKRITEEEYRWLVHAQRPIKGSAKISHPD
jgi:hypothetical protein